MYLYIMFKKKKSCLIAGKIVPNPPNFLGPCLSVSKKFRNGLRNLLGSSYFQDNTITFISLTQVAPLGKTLSNVTVLFEKRLILIFVYHSFE